MKIGKFISQIPKFLSDGCVLLSKKQIGCLQTLNILIFCKKDLFTIWNMPFLQEPKKHIS